MATETKNFRSIQYPFNNQTVELFPTMGAGLVGLFYEVKDILCDDPDEAAWGTIGIDTLTPEWREAAEYNSTLLEEIAEEENAANLKGIR